MNSTERVKPNKAMDPLAVASRRPWAMAGVMPVTAAEVF